MSDVIKALYHSVDRAESASPCATPQSLQPMVLHTRVVTGVGGGPEKTILNSPRFLSHLGYDSVCAYMHPPGDPGFERLQIRAANSRAILVSVPDRGPFDFRIVRQFIRLCRTYNVAIWHAHDYKSNILGLLIRSIWPMKLVITAHGWVSRDDLSPFYHRIDKIGLRWYDAVICVSDDLYKECLSLGIPPLRCHLIHNAVDLDQFHRSEELTMRSGLPPRPLGLLIGGMGRLAAEKGFTGLIHTVAALIRDGYDLTLWIAGDGPEREQLQEQIQELGLYDRIVLLAHVNEPKSFFAQLDMFVLSSLREGLPNVLLEAMAMQVPVVATRVAGVPTLVQDRQNGLLVPIDSPFELASAIRSFAENAELRARLGEAGRQTVEESFCFAERMRQVATLYDNILTRAIC